MSQKSAPKAEESVLERERDQEEMKVGFTVKADKDLVLPVGSNCKHCERNTKLVGG